MKKCLECELELPLSDFYTNGKRERADGSFEQRYKPRCKKCEALTTRRKFFSRLKEALNILGMDLECSNCGYDEYFAALEFHHVDPEEKDIQISNKKNATVETLVNELDKCIVLCSNCHRVEHTVNNITPEEIMQAKH